MRTLRAVGFLLLAAVLAGCGTPTPAPGDRDRTVLGTVEPGFVRGTDGSAADRLAATVVTDVQAFWRAQFPRTFGHPWRDVRRFRSVGADAPGAPCTERRSDIGNNALYCAAADTVSWDRETLLPRLRGRFGTVAVVVVLGHELGHAAAARSGVRAGAPGYPTIVTEAMADCYSGAALRWIADGHAEHLRIGKPQLDRALQALVSFRDPVGRAAAAQAHGDAFDRASAFSDGYTSGAGLCSRITEDGRAFTQAPFVDMDDATSGGNLGYRELLGKLTPDLTAWLRGRDPRFTPPPQRPVDTACGHQGPAAYCDGQVQTSARLPELHAELGDWATGTLLASRYALALRAATGRPRTGTEASAEVLCLAGAYSGMLLRRRSGFGLSPGDLDESVQLLLRFDYASRDAGGVGIGSGFDRLQAFRGGVTGGAGSCR